MKYSLSFLMIVASLMLENQVAADIVITGNIDWTIDGTVTPETIDFTTSRSFGAGPLPATGSAIQIDYASSKSDSRVALNWQVQQTRGASSNSRTLSRLETSFFGDSDLNYTLGLNWNGLSVPTGLAALTVSIKDSLNTTYLSVSANRFQGFLGGGFNSSYAGTLGTLQTGQEYTLILESVLLSGGEATPPASTFGDFSFTIAAVPEPSSLVLVLICGCTVFVRSRTSSSAD